MVNMQQPVNKTFDLSGKAIVLTGGAGLLASEFADALSAAGANVILADIKEEECSRRAETLSKRYHTNSIGVFLDLTDCASIEAMTTYVLSKYTKIDVLINNAVYNPPQREFHAPFHEFTLENWDQILAVNLTGTFLCTQVVTKHMLKQGHGNVINISSIYGIVGADQRIYGNSGINTSIAYAASKGGVVSLTRYLSAYFVGANIRINTLTLGGVFNDQDADFVAQYSARTQVGRMANKSEYRGAIVYLASDASSYMTGANLIVDGGWTSW
jgi:NAD(P)-dependent dehydrogenase (short-subunit alcohol dehydrogenase family)